MSEQTAGTGPAAADFGDRRDFVNADRGFIGTIEPMVIKAADGRVVWDMDSWGFLDWRLPGHGEPEPVAAGPADGQARPVRGNRRDLPGPRVRDVQHDAGRKRPRRHRHRPADLPGGRGCGARAVPPAPRRPRRHGRHLHPRPPRPLRRGARRGRGRHRRPDPRAGALPGARGVGERLRRDGDAAPQLLLRRYRPAQERDRHAGDRAGRGRVDRHSRPDRADPLHHPHRAGGGPRRRPHRLPAHPRHRVPGRDELLLPGQAGAVPGRERHPQPAQPADPARRPGPRPADLVAIPGRGDRAVRPRVRRGVRLAPLAHLGHQRSSPT